MTPENKDVAGLLPSSEGAVADALRAFVDIKPLGYGAVGTRDIDMAQWNEAHRAAKVCLEALAAPGAAIAAREQELHTIEGTVTFTRSDPATQVCVCCPKGSGHIFGRRVKWDDYSTNRPDHFGTSANVFVDSRVTDFNKNEGRRVRLTVELLPVAAEQGKQS